MANIYYRIVSRLFPSLIWNMDNQSRIIYLTFDDSPSAEYTLDLLNLLSKFHIKATFFCVGEKLEASPGIGHKIIRDGHSLGGHGFRHDNFMWRSLSYFRNDLSKLSDLLSEFIPAGKKLYRFPYGKFKPSQIRELEISNFIPVQWSLNSADYKKKHLLNLEHKLKTGSSAGDIILFHDAGQNTSQLFDLLPKLIEFWQKSGFTFENLNSLLKK